MFSTNVEDLSESASLDKRRRDHIDSHSNTVRGGYRRLKSMSCFLPPQWCSGHGISSALTMMWCLKLKVNAYIMAADSDGAVTGI